MEISYKSGWIKKRFESKAKAQRQWGDENAHKLLQRHAELLASENLEDFGKLPHAGSHPLTGNRRGQFACYGKYPFRLVFEPDHDPVPRKPDGGVDLRKVTRIKIVTVENYHGK